MKRIINFIIVMASFSIIVLFAAGVCYIPLRGIVGIISLITKNNLCMDIFHEDNIFVTIISFSIFIGVFSSEEVYRYMNVAQCEKCESYTPADKKDYEDK